MLKWWPMNIRLAIYLLLLFVPLPCSSQSNTFVVVGASNAQVPRHFDVEAADHDPTADTPEKIAAVNSALAAKGNVDAAWQLALAYLQGYGVPQDLTLAESWFEKGANTPGRASLVGSLYAQGEYFPKIPDAAEHWYTVAGSASGLFNLAETYKAASENEKASALYLKLLTMTGHPEVRLAQMELGNFVIDGFYSAGDDAKSRAQNLEWARIIAQELLGQQEYTIAIDYNMGRENLPIDKAMWLRYCKRAAAYNIDLAQKSYAQGMMDGSFPDLSGHDYVAWTRLASEKQFDEIAILKAITEGMSPEQTKAANAAYDSFVLTRKTYGAYYPADDPLRNPSASVLAAMPDYDPDVQLRKAFALEPAAANDAQLYAQVLDIYRTIRDQRETISRYALGRNALTGANGVPKNRAIAEYWLHEAANRGSAPAKEMLTKLTLTTN